MSRDTWLTHYSHYLASVRAIIYAVTMVGRYKKPSGMERVFWANATGMAYKRAEELETLIRQVYRGDTFSYRKGQTLDGLGQNYGIFSRVVHGQNRCSTLQSWLKSTGSDYLQQWPGDEEKYFHKHLHPTLYKEQAQNQFLHIGNNSTAHTSRHGITSGILDVKYTFKTLSDMGFIELALEKASSTLEYKKYLQSMSSHEII
jgi:hypothetical protein